MIGLLMGLGLPARAAKLVSWGLIAIAVVGALWWLRHDAYGDGRRFERAQIEKQIAADKAAQAARERQADENLRKQQAKDTVAADQRRKDIDDATRNIPDQGLTARQRARACLGLRAEAKAHGRPQPAC